PRSARKVAKASARLLEFVAEVVRLRFSISHESASTGRCLPDASPATNGESTLVVENSLPPHSEYRIRLKTPSVETYLRLRAATGLSAKSTQAALQGLPNSIFAVQILHRDDVVGMGRIIGDGGCFFQVVDVAVVPEHQGKGLGKAIMSQIKKY